MGVLLIACAVVFPTCRMDNVVAPPVSGVLVPSSSAVADSAPLASVALRVSKVALGVSQPGSLAWRAERARNSAWVILPRTTGNAPDSLEIRLDPAGLAPGVYRDTVVLSTNNYEAPPLRVPVEFNVHPCRVTPVPLDTVLNSPLSGADCGMAVAGRFARLFGFPGTAGDSITLELVATGFDATLVLDTVATRGTALPIAQATSCRGVVGDPCLPYTRLPVTGTYYVEVSGPTPPAGGTFVLHVKEPKPPATPDQTSQRLADSVTVIGLGAVVTAQPIVFRATLSDPDVVDTLRLELELRSTAAAFTGTPTHTSTTVANGTAATIVTTVPDDSGYHWRARTVDQTGRRSNWFVFGGNSETAADFTSTVPQLPGVPTALAQLRGSDLAPIAVGGASPVPEVTFRAQVSDPDPGDQLHLEIEVRPIGSAFTNAPTHQGAPVASGGTAAVAVTGLIDNTPYHWQARVVDQSSRASVWVAYGANTEVSTDFEVAVPATQLVFTVQPTSTTAAQPFSPAIRVTALDGNGVTAVSFADTIELQLGAPTGGATLSGTIKVKATLGVAIFTNARVDRTGTGYRLVASTARLPGFTVTSTPFNILPGPPAQIAYTLQPATVTSAEPLTVQVVVQDAGGNLATGFNGTVTASLGTNPAGGALSGTLSATAVAGHATLSNLRIDKAGVGYTLVVGGVGLTNAVSLPFTVTPAAAAVLEFTDQPVLGDAGLPLVPAAQVTARDAQGNLATGFTGDVTLAIGDNPGAGALAGIATRAAVAGVATFPGLSIDKVGTGYTFVATATGPIVPDTSAPFNIRAADGARLVFRAHPRDTVAGAPLGSPVQIGVQDAFGNLATGFTGSIVMTLSANPSGGTLGGTDTITVVAGLANFLDLYVDKVGTGYTLTASSTGLIPETSDAFDITHAPASRLAFTVQPTTIVAGTGITPSVQVIARDAFDNTATAYTGQITVEIGANPGTGTLSGTAQISAVAGLATFPGLTIDKVGIGYTLTAAATGLTGATSGTFNVTPAPASQLAFTVQPSNAVAAAVITPAVSVTARDQFGNTATGFTGGITAGIGTNPGSGTLGGTAVVNAVAGVATFSNLSINKSGTGYTLTAAATGLSSAISSAFNIGAGVTTKLAFTVQPSDEAAGNLITPAVQVTARDANDNATPGFTGPVTIAIGTNPGTPPGVLSGTLTANAVAGVATFGTLSINRTGGGYTLTAASPNLTGATSTPFAITASPATQLVFTSQPTSVIGGAGFTVVVTARDLQGNTATGFTGNVEVALAANPAGGTLSGTKIVAAVAGVATFSGLSLDRVGAGYTLSASTAAAGTAGSAAISVTAGPAAVLVFTVSPGTSTAGEPLAPVIEVVARDLGGNTATTFTRDVTLSIGNNPAGGELSGSFTRTAAAGVVTFPNVRINRAGTGYTLMAVSTGVADGTSAEFEIVPGAPASLSFVVQPSTAVAGTSIDPAVQVIARDAQGNNTPTFAGSVSLSLLTNPGGSVLLGGGAVAAIGGVATFPNVSLNKVAAGYVLQASAAGLNNANSAAFAITPGAATELAFSVQPTITTAGEVIAPAVQVLARDAFGNFASGFNGDVTMGIATNPSGGTLSGTMVRAAVNGIAIFNDLSINLVGQDYRLGASGEGLTGATSFPFNIRLGAATKLAFDVQPTTQQAGVPIAPTVRVDVQDAHGNRAYPYVGTVTLTLLNANGAVLTAGGPVNVSDGLATFTGLRVNKVGENYTLQAAAPGLTGVVSVPFNIIPGTASVLEFTVQPLPQTVSAVAMAPAIEVLARDNQGNIATAFAGAVTMSLGANPAGGALAGTVTVDATAGLAVFSNLSIAKSGAGYRLRASADSIPGVLSAPFTIAPAAASQLVFATQPLTTVAGQSIAPPIQVRALDPQGNIATDFGGIITVAIGANPSAGILGGVTSAAASAGVVTFSGLTINAAGEGYTLTVDATGLSGATSTAFDITPGGISSLVFTQQPSSATAGVGISPDVVVTALDAQGNRATGFSGNVNISIGTNPGSGLLSGTSTVAAVNGVATFAGLRINRTGNGYTLVTSAAAIPAVMSSAFNISPAPASALVFSQQPTVTTAGRAITPGVQVTALDSLGNTATSYNGTITMAIGNNPGASTLTGIPVAAAVLGVATFPNLRLNRTGTGYTLTAAAAGLTGATSAGFNIVPAPAAALSFTTQPINGVAATAIPAVVTARDSLGNTATSYTGNVSLAIGANPSGGVITSGSVAAVAGVATLSFSINASGNGYTVVASGGGVVSATSTPFNIIAGPAAQLVYTVQPSNATAGVANTPAVQVTARDAQNNVATGFTGNVTIAIGTNPGGGTLTGAPTVPAAAGIATFTNLRINRSGTGYTLVATAAGPSSATSVAFNITHAPASVLVVTVQPTNTTAGVAITPAVEITARDSMGNTATGYTGNVTMAIGTNPGGSLLTGTPTVAAVGGIASFPNLRLNRTGTGYTLTAAAALLTGTTTTAFNISPAPASILVVTAQPTNAIAGVAIAPPVQVTARDSLGNTATSFSANVTMAIGNNPGTSTLGGTPVVAAAAGVATFTNLRLNRTGTGYTLAASAAGVTGTTTGPFNIAPAPPSSLVFSTQPTNAAAGIAVAPAIQVSARDSVGNPTPSFAGNVSLSLLTNPGGSVLQGGGAVAAIGGVATFPAVSLNKVAAGYVLQASASGVSSGTSAAFAITPGVATELAFSVHPTITTAGEVIAPAVQVLARDAFGNFASGFNGDVTMGIATNPSGGTLSGTIVRAAVNGVAIFNDLSINFVGQDYRLGVSGVGLTGATSFPFNIRLGTATKLAFDVQPTTQQAGVPIAPTVRVDVQDAQGNRAYPYVGTVTLTLLNANGAVLTAGGPVNVSDGLATFTGLRVDKVGTNYTLQAAAAGLTGVVSTPFNIVPATASTLEFTVQPPAQTVAAVAMTPAIQVLARDNQGNVATTFTGNVTLGIGANPGGGILAGTATQAAVNGLATFPGLSINKSGTGYTLQANSTGVTGASSNAFNIVPGTATQLTFAVQPVSTVAGAPITPTVQVNALDAQGNLATGFGGGITLNITTNPGGGVLSGGGTIAAVAGVATFPALSINAAGTGYTITATAAGLTPTTSTAFNIGAGGISQLVFTVQPTNAIAGATIAPAIQVTARDNQGNTATDFTGSITIGIGANPGGSVLFGPNTVNAVSGVATFPNLGLTRTGTGYTLVASAGGTPGAISAAFNIAHAPASVLVFTTHPVNTTAGAAITPAVQVTARDTLGNTATSFTGNVTVAIGANPGSSTLTGTPTVAAVAGTATFANLRLNRSGSGYTLAAAAGGLTPVTSAGFDITPGPATQLAFVVQPVSTTAGLAITPAVQVHALDAQGNTATGFAGNISIALGANPGGGVLSGGGAVAALGGVATFPALSINAAAAGYTLAATSAGLTGTTSVAFNIASGGAAQLVFTVQPSNAVAGVAIAPPVQVTARDLQGNVATGFTGIVNLAIANNPGGSLLTGTSSVAAVAGVAVFNNLRLNRTGTGYTLGASATGPAGATSSGFNITPAPASVLVVTAQPTNATAGVAISPAVQVTARDSVGNTATSFNGNITMAIGANPGGSLLTGNPTVAAAAGVANFSNLRLNRSGTGYTLTAAASGLTGATTGTFNIAPAPASVLVYTTQPTNVVAGAAIAPAVVVTARDSVGNTATSFTGPVTIAIGTNPGGGVLTGGGSVPAVAGVVTLAGLRINATGTGYTLTATSGGLPVATSGAFSVVPDVAAQLVFTVQPSNVVAGVANAPAVQVTARDAQGNVATGFTGVVTIGIGNNPGGSLLTGTPSVAAVAGVATFNNLRLNRTGTGYTLLAAATGTTGATSTAFNVTPAPASVLAMTVQPTNTTAGIAITPAVQVTARDSVGNTATSYTGNVTIAIGTNPGGSLLTGTPTVAAVAGVANFTNLRLNRPANGYTLLAAASGLVGATSTSFNITPAPASVLVVTVQPTNTVAGVAINPPVQVTARDSLGNTVTGFAGTVTASIGANPGSATLSGTPAVTAVAGVATFTNLRLDRTGTGYTLVASSAGVASGTTAAFNITPAPASVLVVTTQPANGVAGAPIAPAVQVTARDSVGNTATSFSGTVTMALSNNPGGSTLTGTPAVAAVAGVATFPNLRLNRPGTGYTLTATAAGVTGATTAGFTIVAAPASVLAFTVQPTNSTAGVSFTPTVQVTVRDSMGNTATNFNGDVTVAIGNNPGGSTLSGASTISATAGVVSFGSISLNRTGNGYTLVATATGMTSATSTAFNITPGAPNHVAFTVQPTTAVAATGIAPAVQVTARDNQGNTTPSFTGNITVTIVTNPGGGILSGTTTVAAVSGVATFPGLSINKTGNNYQLGAGASGLASGTSAVFNITPGAAAQLEFTVHPNTAIAGVTISPAVRVTALDAQGNIATQYTGNVTMAIGTNPGGGTLSGTLVRAAAAGVATFDNLSINRAAQDYRLSASASGLTSAQSFQFNINAGPAAQLSFEVHPTDAVVDVAIAPTVRVRVEDVQGNTIFGYVGSITLTLTNPNGAILTAGGPVAVSDGRANFPGLRVNQAGTYTLTAASGGLANGLSSAFNITGVTGQ